MVNIWLICGQYVVDDGYYMVNMRSMMVNIWLMMVLTIYKPYINHH